MSCYWCSLFLLPTTWTLILTHRSGSVFRLPVLGSTELRSVGSVFRFRRLRCQIFSPLFRARSVELPKLFRSIPIPIRHRNFPMQSKKLGRLCPKNLFENVSMRSQFWCLLCLFLIRFKLNAQLSWLWLAHVVPEESWRHEKIPQWSVFKPGP